MARQFRTGNHALVRELNRSIILNQLRLGPLSRAELAVRSGLNKTTVSSLVDELITDQFVREVGFAASAGGRPAVPLELNSAAGCIIGVEIGVGYVNVALTDFCADILWKRQISIGDSDGQRQIIKRAITLVRQALQRGERTGTRSRVSARYSWFGGYRFRTVIYAPTSIGERCPWKIFGSTRCSCR
jgi:hypothetical protein